ncbi:MAG: GNAT family N-acetyltransferase [Bacteroidota bacterium]|nr:GNAT family N-acetyltransferase [Bacteroidota bacterium]
MIREAPLTTIWQIRHEVMYPDHPFDSVKLEDDALGLHFGYYVENKPVAVVSVFFKNGALQFRKLATKVGHQQKGYASALLEYVMQLARDKKCSSVWCNARITAVGLYHKFHMKEVGETWRQFGLEFIKMEKQLN